MLFDVNVGRCKVLFQAKNRKYHLNFEGKAHVVRSSTQKGFFWTKTVYGEPIVTELNKAEIYAEKYILKVKEQGGIVLDNIWYNFEDFELIQILDIEDFDKGIETCDYNFGWI